MASGQEAEGRPLLEKRSERKGKVTVAVIALSNLCAWSCISLIAPFFPIEAARKGTGETVIGLIYSSSELVIFLMSPVFGKLLTENSPRFFYIAGLCVFGTCDVMFGFLNKSPSGVPFIIICFAVRIVEAIGTASIMTASYAIVGNNFPERIGTVYGIIESVTGLGFLVGPSLGGALYEAGGYGLPFWVLGSCVFVCGCASCAVLPEQGCVEIGTGPSSLTLLRSPRAWFGSFSIVSSLMGLTIWGPVFAQHLEQFGLSQSIIGLIFIIPAATYTLTTPMWGWLLDRNLSALPLVTIGLCCTAVIMLFFGPAPFFTFLTPELWLTIVTLTLMGLTLAPVIISGMRCIVQGARELGFKDDTGTFGLVGGMVQSSNCLGTFVGPLLGGALTESFGFGWAMVVSAGILMLPIFTRAAVLISTLANRAGFRLQRKMFRVIVFCPFLVHTAQKKYRGSSFVKRTSYVVLEGETKEKANSSFTSSQF